MQGGIEAGKQDDWEKKQWGDAECGQIEVVGGGGGVGVGVVGVWGGGWGVGEGGGVGVGGGEGGGGWCGE